jgi:hypothetical protein
MQNFIVLGLIPGTNFEATFTLWLYVVSGVIALPMLRQLWRQRTALRHYIVARLVAREITRAITQFQLPA